MGRCESYLWVGMSHTYGQVSIKHIGGQVLSDRVSKQQLPTYNWSETLTMPNSIIIFKRKIFGQYIVFASFTLASTCPPLPSYFVLLIKDDLVKVTLVLPKQWQFFILIAPQLTSTLVSCKHRYSWVSPRSYKGLGVAFLGGGLNPLDSVETDMIISYSYPDI